MMRVLGLLSILAVIAQCQGQTIIQQICSADRQMTSIQPGADILIGGLFEIRNLGTNGSGCGRPLTDTMQVFEAARYAVNYLNSYNGGSGYISGVKFGMDAYDTCLSASHAVSALEKLYPQSTSSNPFCTQSNRVIAGTVGPLSSWTTLPAAVLAGQLPASIISPTASNPELSDKIKYPTFLRTVPSYGVFANVIVELLQRLQWQNVVVVYTDDAYGISGYEQLLRATYSRGLCVSQAVKLSAGGNKDVYKAALSALGSTSSSAGILMAPNVLTKVILQALGELPALAQIQWILGDIDITNSVSSLKYALGTLVVVPRFPAIDDFRQYFSQLLSSPRTNVGNPWFQDWFEEAYGCSLTSSTCPASPRFVQSPWAVPAMLAVFAYAEAVRTVCLNSGGGLCSQLTTMTPTDFNNVLRALNFTLPSNFPAGLSGRRIKFDANGDPEVSDFTIYNYISQQEFQEIGRYESNVLTLDRPPTFYDSTRSTPLTNNVTATCASLGCQNCLLPQRFVTYRYKQGDLVIASLADAHEPGQAPFTCGAGRASQLASLVAAEWALSQYKVNNPGQLQQISLGSLVADVCPDSAVAQGFLTDLLSGNNMLVDSTGAVISYTNIQAFVDDISSEQAEIISPIVSKYNIPEVVTSVTTKDVSRGVSTPYFARTVPNEDVVYSAISNFLSRLGWNYVQVATQSSGKYKDMAENFKDVAARYGICVVDTADYFGDGMADPYNRMVTRLLGNAGTQVVIVFASMMDMRGLLTAIGQRGAVGQLQLIAGMDDWGRNPAYIRGLETYASGAIVIDFELSGSAPAFSTYLQSLTLSQIVSNPFLRELFEITNQCVLDPASQSTYVRICSSMDNFSNVYLGRAPYTIQSVNAVINKLGEIITEVCNSSSSLCPEFRSVTDVGSRLSAKLANLSPKSNGFGTINGEANTNFGFYVYNQGWALVGQYMSESQSLSVSNLAALGNYQNKSAVCSGVCRECHYLFTLQADVFTDGDWIIAGAFGISKSGPERLQPYICGDIKTENGPQFTMAMLYALQQVNSGTAPVSVRGVRFGSLVLDHCSNPGLADLMVSDIYADFPGHIDVDSSKILAWITDTNESTNETVKILDPLGVATVSPSASSVSLMRYPTFFRTIQGDAASAAGLVTIVKLLGHSYIQVVYSPSSYGREGLNVLTTTSQTEGICITNSIEFSVNTSDIVKQLLDAQANIVILYLGATETESILTAMSNSPEARRSLVILMPQPYTEIVSRVGGGFTFPIISLQLQKFNLSSYNSYINTLPISSPYFARYYMTVMGCDLPGYLVYNRPCPAQQSPLTSSGSYKEDNFVLSTINAFYAIVEAQHRTVSEYCGSNYTKPCSNFLAAPDRRQTFLRNLNSVNFVDDGRKNFRFLSREGETAYDILQSSSSGSYSKVGRYSGQTLDFSDAAIASYTNVTSTCVAPCLGCIMKGLNFSHTVGDIYLAGMFDVHYRSLSPFTCGKIQTLHGYLLLEAFHYAIGQVNAKQGQFANILPGTRLGGIGLDACQSDVRGGYLVSNIHSGIVTLAKDNTVIYPSMIDAYIGSYSSTASLYLARILTDLKIPQISYAAGSEELSDQRVYPYFFRTVPTDSNQVEAMLKLMDELDIRYVQTLYDDNSNGISANNFFVKRAASYRICVASQVPYPDFGIVSSELSNVVAARLLENVAANTVVTFLSTDYVNSVLQSLKMSNRARNKFRFIGSDAWADSQEAILNAESQAKGSITIRLDADDVQDFENYINSKNLANSKDNPWFEEYFQDILNCYTSKANTMNYPYACPSSAVNLINSPRYQQDTGVVYVINAVYAAAFAIDETLKDICGPGYTAVCQAYRNDPVRHAMIRDNLASVSFDDPVGHNFMFVNRSGLADYKFQSIDSGLIGYSYQPMGSYNVTSGIVSISSTYTSTWDSDCDRADTCAQCPEIRDQGVRYAFYDLPSTPDNAITVVAFFDVHKQGVDPYRCGEINVPGFQQLLAFFYTLEKVRPTDRYRFLAIDTCSNSLRVDQDLFGLLEGTGLCNTRFDDSKLVSIKNLGSVITIGNLNTIAASRVLEQPGITYLSPNALSTLLDEKQHLVRTIAPISAMMKTLVSFLSKVGWTYVDVVYEGTVDGVNPFQRFANYANLAKVCRGSSLLVPAGSSDADIQNFLARLNGNKGSRAVILLGSYSFVKRVMAIANAMKIANRYIWILGVEWDLTTDLLKDLIPYEVEIRIITARRLNYIVESFNNYFNSLRYTPSSLKIPQEWFDEFYQQVFNCTISFSAKPINIGRGACNTTKQLSSLNLMMEMYILNSVAATFSAIEGLSTCAGPCSGSLDNATSRAEILKSILNVERQLNSGMGDLKLSDQTAAPTLKFDKENRWWDSGYVITYYYVTKSLDGSLKIMNDNVLVEGDFNPTTQWISDTKRIVNISSVCTEDAADGGCSCTYEDTGTPTPLISPRFIPSEPRNYYAYHSNGSQQYDWPIWAITVAVLTSAGLILAVILFLILIFAYPVRGGTSALGYMVIVGIIGIYAINFAFFVHATNATCGARRFLMGVVYMIAFGPLLIKAVDNWRYSHYNEEKQRYSGISSAFVLFMIAVSVVLIQCIIPIIWLILVHPTATEWAPYAFAPHDNWWCDPPEIYDTGLVQSFIFVMFIVLVTAIFSALAFDSDRNNFESRWILFSCIVTAGCFLVWMIVSTNAGPSARDASVTIANLVNATLLLIALPLRKCVLLCRHLRDKEKEEEAREVLNNGNGHMYSNSYDNEGLDLYDLDSQYVRNSKPSEF